MSADDLTQNPLFFQADLPDFTKITPSHVVPAVREALRLGREALARVEKLENPTWETFVLPLREVTRRIDRIWGAVNHLMGVKNSPELRAAHEKVQPEIVEFQLAAGQSRALHNTWQALQKAAARELTTEARQRIASAALRDARLSGVALEGKGKDRFNEIQGAISPSSRRVFRMRCLMRQKNFNCGPNPQVARRVHGLPESWLQMAAQMAEAKGQKGWLVTLDFPSYYPFLQHAKNRSLREKVYRANAVRASGTGFSEKWNNWPLIDEILKLRREMAILLGYQNYAEVSRWLQKWHPMRQKSAA